VILPSNSDAAVDHLLAEPLHQGCCKIGKKQGYKGLQAP